VTRGIGRLSTECHCVQCVMVYCSVWLVEGTGTDRQKESII